MTAREDKTSPFAEAYADYRAGARSTPSLPVQDAEIYLCPDGCGCTWRDNRDGSMSLAGPNSKSCKVCEFLPLKKLIPLWRGSTPSPDPPQTVQREEWDETVEEWMNHALKEMCLVARSGCKHTEYMTHTDGLRQPLILAMGRCLGYGLAECERLREALWDWRRQLLDAWANDHRATMTALLENGPEVLAPSLPTKGEK